LLAILSGCGTASYKPILANQNLPEMPVAGSKVADELENICSNETCHEINEWLNELYFFKQEYQIHKGESWNISI